MFIPGLDTVGKLVLENQDPKSEHLPGKHIHLLFANLSPLWLSEDTVEYYSPPHGLF